MLKTTRARFIGLTAVAVALVVAPPALAAPPKEQTFTYVAADFYVVGPDLIAAEVADATGQQVAPLGTARYLPGGDRLTLFIDDVGTPFGPIYVTISGRSSSTSHCIPVRQSTTLRAIQGEFVTITVWGAAFGAWTPCGAGGTAGTLKVSG